MPARDATGLPLPHDNEELLRRRIRQGLWIYIWSIIFIDGWGILSGQTAHSLRRFEVFSAQVLSVVCGALLLRVCRSYASLSALGAAIVTTAMATSTVRGIFATESVAPSMLVAGVTLGVAAMVPWPVGVQVYVVLIGLISIFVNVTFVHGLGEAIRPLIAGTVVGMISIYIAREIERMRCAVATELALREQAERESRAARDEALRASEFKSAFLATMSHEVRNPIGVIAGMSEILLDGDLPDEPRELVGSIHRSSIALSRLINDVLDLSKIEAGKVELTRTCFEPRRLVDDVRDLFALEAQRKGIELSTAVDSAVPHEVCGDPVRLGQVFTNIVGNAVKFTESGSVRLSVRVENHAEDAVVLAVAVTDTGIGIAAAEQAKLFDAYSQAQGADQRRFGGSGLGLAICKQLVELMQGTIDLRSRPGEGTTVSFTVRMVPAMSADSSHPTADERAASR